MFRKLLAVIGVTALLLSGCLSGTAEVPPAEPSVEAPAEEEPAEGLSGGGTVPPSVEVDRWSGWAQVPGGATTDVALAAAAFDNKLYLLSKSLDGRVYLNTYNGYCWSDWTEVPGGLITDVPLAAAAFSDKLYIFAKGTDNHIYFDICDISGNWRGWAEVPGGCTTDVALAPVVFNDELYVFAKGIDNHIYFGTYDASNDWHGWAEVPGGVTDVAVTPVVFEDELYLLAKGIAFERIHYAKHDASDLQNRRQFAENCVKAVEAFQERDHQRQQNLKNAKKQIHPSLKGMTATAAKIRSLRGV